MIIMHNIYHNDNNYNYNTNNAVPITTTTNTTTTAATTTNINDNYNTKHLDSSDWLRRSHITWYPCGYCKMELL